MRVALMIEGQEDVTWEDWQALAGACEEHGVESAVPLRPLPVGLRPWRARLARRVGDHQRARGDHVARVRLGTLVSPATFRHPSELAKVVVTADHVSGGRVELGLGTGWLEAEHEAYGFPFPPLGERMRMLERPAPADRSPVGRGAGPAEAAAAPARRT